MERKGQGRRQMHGASLPFAQVTPCRIPRPGRGGWLEEGRAGPHATREGRARMHSTGSDARSGHRAGRARRRRRSPQARALRRPCGYAGPPGRPRDEEGPPSRRRRPSGRLSGRGPQRQHRPRGADQAAGGHVLAGGVHRLHRAEAALAQQQDHRRAIGLRHDDGLVRPVEPGDLQQACPGRSRTTARRHRRRPCPSPDASRYGGHGQRRPGPTPAARGCHRAAGSTRHRRGPRSPDPSCGACRPR